MRRIQPEWDAIQDDTCGFPALIGDGSALGSLGCYSTNPWADDLNSIFTYWSSATYNTSTRNAWAANNANGITNPLLKSLGEGVWPVR